MDDTACQIYIKGAEKLIKTSSPPEVYFWEGYHVGMSSHYERDYHEHPTFLSFFSSKDLMWHIRGIGYRTGFSGIPLSIARLLAKRSKDGFIIEEVLRGDMMETLE